MQRKKSLIGAIVGVMLLAVGNLPAQAENLGKFAWQLEPFCDVIVFQVAEDEGVFALHGFDRMDPPPVCEPGPAIYSAYGTGSEAPDGTIILGFDVVFKNDVGASPIHYFATLDPATLSGPWMDEVGFTGHLQFLGQAHGAAAAASMQPSYQSSRNK